jgi:hypothetical protein
MGEVGPRQLMSAVVLLPFLWLSIAYATHYTLTAGSHLCRMLLGILQAIAEGFKSNMLLIGVWVFILGVFKRLSLSRMVYRAMMGMLNREKECSICLN